MFSTLSVFYLYLGSWSVLSTYLFSTLYLICSWADGLYLVLVQYFVCIQSLPGHIVSTKYLFSTLSVINLYLGSWSVIGLSLVSTCCVPGQLVCTDDAVAASEELLEAGLWADVLLRWRRYRLYHLYHLYRLYIT